MNQCRILTPTDENLIPAYVELFNDILTEISLMYPPSVIKEARERYTSQHICDHLQPNPDLRFIAHETNQTLDGLLIEGFDQLDGERTTIKWVLAAQKGRGIGTQLIQDCIQRAAGEGKDVVSLGVAVENHAARRLYQRLGFISGGRYTNSHNQKMEVMGYLLK